MIEIINDTEELEDKEFNPTFDDDEETEEFESAEETKDTEEEEKPLAPVVEMPTKTEETEEEDDDKTEERKPQTVVDAFGGLSSFIEIGLREVAKDDDEFQKCLENPKKSLEDCIKYLIGEVQKKAFQGVSVSEDEHGADLLELAIKYYETEDIKIQGTFATRPKSKEESKKSKETKKSKATSAKPSMSKEEIDAMSASSKQSNTEQPKVFSGYKKGSKAYNDALMNSLQGDLFGGMFNDTEE